MSERQPDLMRLIAEAATLAGGKHPCNVLGHRWKHVGGMACCCEGIRRGCSVPVHECDACGECDYGENAEAAKIRECCCDD